MKRFYFLAIVILLGTIAKAQTFGWAEQFSGNNPNSGFSLARSPSGELIVGGTFEGAVDFDPGDGTFILTSFGGKDAFIAKTDIDGNLIWAKQFGGNEDDYVRNVYCDLEGNIFITGAFQGTSDMDPGDGTFNLTSFGGKDIFINELDEDGNFVWAGQFAGTLDGTGTCIAVSPSGNIYFSGYFIGVFDFDPGAANYYLTAASQAIYTGKLNSNHEIVWAKTMGGPLFDYCESMSLDEEENIYTTGSFENVADFDPGDSAIYLTSAGGNDIYVNKLNSDGEYVWAKQMSGPEDEFGEGIVYDQVGNIYITGYFKSTVDFDPDTSSSYMTSVDDYDVFIEKLDTDGNMLWARQIGGVDSQGGQAITLDNDNNVYCTGHFKGTADFDPGIETYEMTSFGDFDIFVEKLEENGTFVWSADMGGALFDRGLAIITDNQSNVFTTGWFAGTADFEPGDNSYYLTTSGEYNCFLSKLGTDILGVEQNNATTNVSLFPNPATDEFSIEFKDVSANVSVIIYDVEGKVVFQDNYSFSQYVTIQSNFDPGIYFVEIKTSNGHKDLIKLIQE